VGFELIKEYDNYKEKIEHFYKFINERKLCNYITLVFSIFLYDFQHNNINASFVFFIYFVIPLLSLYFKHINLIHIVEVLYVIYDNKYDASTRKKRICTKQ
jgi:hypothetical protein